MAKAFIVRGRTWQYREELKNWGFFWRDELRAWVRPIPENQLYFTIRIRRKLAALAGVTVSEITE